MFLDIQTAIYTQLVNDYGVDDAVARWRNESGDTFPKAAVYVDPPQPDDSGNDKFFPYITIGRDSHSIWDTDTSRGFDSEITVHSWARGNLPNGDYINARNQVKAVQGAIYSALHLAEFSIDNAALVTCHCEMTETVLDPDGKTAHGVQRFRLITDDI